MAEFRIYKSDGSHSVLKASESVVKNGIIISQAV
jgi:hypothetical protein